MLNFIYCMREIKQLRLLPDVSSTPENERCGADYLLKRQAHTSSFRTHTYDLILNKFLDDAVTNIPDV